MQSQNTENLEKELMGLENRYWQAMADHDLAAAVSLTDFPCLVAGANGMMAVDRAQFEKMFNSHQNEVRNFHFERPEVRMLSEDTAVIAYKVQSEVASAEGEKKINAVDTSTWVKRGDKWACAMHTETELRSA